MKIVPIFAENIGAQPAVDLRNNYIGHRNKIEAHL